MKKSLSIILSFVILMSCLFTGVSYAEEESNEYIDTVWAVYYEEVSIDEGLNFVVKYDLSSPLYGYGFIAGYIPEGQTREDVSIWMQLGSEDHFLKLSEDGTYILFVSEKALMEAYELWCDANNINKV